MEFDIGVYGGKPLFILSGLYALEVFDKLLLFLVGQSQFEQIIVVVKDIVQGSEAPIVIETAFLMGKQP